MATKQDKTKARKKLAKLYPDELAFVGVRLPRKLIAKLEESNTDGASFSYLVRSILAREVAKNGKKP